MFIDVHCHVDYFDYGKVRGIVERARRANVGVIVNNGTTVKDNRKSLELAEKYKEIKCALGIYPLHALEMSDAEFESELKFIRRNEAKIAAIGEVGMDFKERVNEARQKKQFQKFIELAIELDRVLIVHSRKAERECIEVLEKANARRVIMHCFSGRMSLLPRIIANKWFFSISTSVVYNLQYQQIAEKIPLDLILCETDAPFMHPFRGKENEPAMVVEAYKKIAEIKKLDLREIEEIVERNYRKLFLQKNKIRAD